MEIEKLDNLIDTIQFILSERTWRNAENISIILKIGTVLIEIGEETTTIEGYRRKTIPTSEFISERNKAYNAIRSTEIFPPVYQS